MRFSGMRHGRPHGHEHGDRPHGHTHGHEHGDRSVYAIAKESCVGCGSCLQACRHGAISGSADRTHQIDPAKCVGCGHCVRACQ